ncbi:hypothetical protein [Blastopirellula marina]|uniref:Uncharacterized protein n=1 Tax=Blastopirellula marina TaxID=124 RepID=A0A2S8F4D6_9BACT|nr:hypothetical protein [Blastopirellula marina]PQO27018.1 hypothetical protein C5Y98_27560 [Blastopirellula marina]PTL41165.1 hypothetical protein C5Y97_27575 [Blastopirellula marina]
MGFSAGGWLRLARRCFLVLLPLTIVTGWWIDRSRQLKALEPQERSLAELRTQVDQLQARLHQHRTFDGFDSTEEVLDVIANTHPAHFFDLQAQEFIKTSDEVFVDAFPALLQLLGDLDDIKRERAWTLLELARKSHRFERFEQDYLVGLSVMLRQPSLPAFRTILKWLREENIKDESIKQALTEKMRDDDDPYAPLAGYTLAALHPDVDIAPRLLEMIERKHSQWRYILHELPKYMPADEAKQWQETYRAKGKFE